MMAKRIQRKRTKGWTMPENAVYVGRPTRWGNPWSVEKCQNSGLFIPEKCREVVVNEYRCWLTLNRSPNSEHHGFYYTIQAKREWILSHIHELKGKDLACWCPLDSPCHADVLLELANQE